MEACFEGIKNGSKDHTRSIVASDVLEGMGPNVVNGNSCYVCLSPDSVDEGRRIYEALSADGEIEMAFDKMFWGSYFASFKDKFGISWMIDVAVK